ncbi:unnamed protein product [Pleuronectes platessa]|uniref:Uncharacterized protein n=1 Tax=Pleuronectes platessa TaxID=8262 RepID=A0A9N7YYW4_PLEPL|nr:unnamed protein product [Pleuronectes platessa]
MQRGDLNRGRSWERESTDELVQTHTLSGAAARRSADDMSSINTVGDPSCASKSEGTYPANDKSKSGTRAWRQRHLFSILSLRYPSPSNYMHILKSASLPLKKNSPRSEEERQEAEKRTR